MRSHSTTQRAEDVQPASTERRETDIESLRNQLAEAPDSLYALLDACDEPRIPAKVMQLGIGRAVSLYRGRAEGDYWAIAPYLVRVDDELLEWIVDELWSTPWGYFAVAPCDLPTLRHHFRRFLTVESPGGKTVYFRFYDPRVLPTFLAAATPEERDQFFGPVEAYYAQQEASGAMSDVLLHWQRAPAAS